MSQVDELDSLQSLKIAPPGEPKPENGLGSLGGVRAHVVWKSADNRLEWALSPRVDEPKPLRDGGCPGTFSPFTDKIMPLADHYGRASLLAVL